MRLKDLESLLCGVDTFENPKGLLIILYFIIK